MKTPIIHFTILIIAIIADALTDNYLIKKKKDVHTVLQYMIREGVFILLAGLFAPNNQYALYSWVLTHFVYWWTFDTIINIVRKKPLDYMSDHGIDQYQRPEIVWFVFKFILAVAASAYFFNQGLYSF